MSTEDRYSVAEFARRYKLAEEQFPAFCELHGVSPDEVVAREEFRKMLERFNASAGPSQTPAPTKPPPEVKEEVMAKEKKQSLSRWAQERKLTRPRVAVLCNAMGWDERSKITEAELQAAINKHLLNKGLKPLAPKE